MRTLLSRIRALFRRSHMDEDLDADIRAHLDLLEADYTRRGATPEAARLAARRGFGGVEPMKEIYRDRRTLPWVEDLRRDVRYALRTLLRNPVFTAVAVLTLSLGIGANTALFSVVNDYLFRTLPVRQPGELVTFRWHGQNDLTSLWAGYTHIADSDGHSSSSFTYASLAAFRDANQTLSDLVAFAPGSGLNVIVRGQAEFGTGHYVSGNLYSSLGVAPILGRSIAPEDDTPSATPVVTITDRYWERRFDRDPTVIGSLVTINNVVFTIAGITPSSLGDLIKQGIFRPSGLCDPVFDGATRAGRRGSSRRPRQLVGADHWPFEAWGHRVTSRGQLHSRLPESGRRRMERVRCLVDTRAAIAAGDCRQGYAAAAAADCRRRPGRVGRSANGDATARRAGRHLRRDAPHRVWQPGEPAALTDGGARAGDCGQTGRWRVADARGAAVARGEPGSRCHGRGVGLASGTRVPRADALVTWVADLRRRRSRGRIHVRRVDPGLDAPWSPSSLARCACRATTGDAPERRPDHAIMGRRQAADGRAGRAVARARRRGGAVLENPGEPPACRRRLRSESPRDIHSRAGAERVHAPECRRAVHTTRRTTAASARCSRRGDRGLGQRHALGYGFRSRRLYRWGGRSRES